MLTLLAIGALVLDLGLSWMLNRHEQNAADPAALAAARWIPKYDATGLAMYGPSGPDEVSPPGLMWQEACAVAIQNGFFAEAKLQTNPTQHCTSDMDGDRGARLTVNYPPAISTGAFATQGYVQVVIEGTHPSFFARIFGQANADVAASAVAKYDLDSGANAFSIRVLDPGNTCSAFKVTGSGAGNTKVVVDGAIHVNSTCGSSDTTGSGVCESESSSALFIQGGGSIDAGDKVYVAGNCKGAADAITPPGQLVEGAARLPDPYTELRPPRFDELPAGVCNGEVSLPSSTGCDIKTDQTLSPGVYYGGWKITKPSTDLKLLPGAYIIAGGGIVQNGGTISSIADPTTGEPAAVLLYSTDNPNYAAACQAAWTNSSRCQNGMNLNSADSVDLQGITSGRWKGMLLWQDERGSCPTSTSQCALQVGSQDSLTISGTIYAPDQEVIFDGGSTGTGVATVQIMSWHLTLTGGSQITMPYDPSAILDLSGRGLVQ
jgi:hypothetical protein